MRLFTSIAGLRCYLNSERFGHYRLEPSAAAPHDDHRPPLDIGFVPTMGALHAGHLSLIQRARQDNKIVVVSIFVNPLQFGPNEDFQRYPRTLEPDRVLCEAAGVDALFVPSGEEMGMVPLPLPAHRAHSSESHDLAPGEIAAISPGGTHAPAPVTQVIPPQSMIAGLCGRSRLGHFAGVATIVTKLLNIVQPTRAYFGQKDAQQLAVIRQLVQDLNLPVQIVACPIVREADGLAMSSRNQYLSAVEREQAGMIYRALQRAEQLFGTGVQLSSTLVEAVKAELRQIPAIAQDYIELVDPITMETLHEVKDAGLLAVAARLGTTRLIDNVLLTTRRPIVAIDGPAGAGKSTVARLVAQSLGLFYLDTGAMYRALTWLVLEAGVSVDDEPAIAELLSQCQIEFSSPDLEDFQHLGSRQTPQILVNGQDVTLAVRSLEVTSNVSTIAAQPTVREQLVKRQQHFGRQGGVVMEGRDIGTYVFPEAEVKIFLTASVQERARRRYQDLVERGIQDVDVQELEQAISDRDRKDSTRLIAPLRKAADAVEINTDDLTIQQVCDRIVSLYQDRLAIAIAR